MAFPIERLQVKELRRILAEEKLSTSGKKATMVQRLKEHYSSKGTKVTSSGHDDGDAVGDEEEDHDEFSPDYSNPDERRQRL